MSVIVRLINLLLILTLTSLISAAELSDYRAEVSVLHKAVIDLKADGMMTFQHTSPNAWELVIDVKGGPGKSYEKTVGDINDGEYRPKTFKRATKILFIKENIDWTFDWQGKKVTGTVQKDDYQHALNSTIHDPNSFQIPLRQGLMDGQKKFSFTFMRYNRPSSLQFEVIGEELLTLDAGRVHTLILKQTKPLRSDEKKLIWVAKDYDYIPVRFTTYKKDKIKDDVVVEKLWINDQKISFDR